MNRRRTGSRETAPTTKISHQPPRLLIVHIAAPSWADICLNLCEALKNFFSIACNLMGPSRMSLFSLYTVQNQHECVLPFVVSLSVLMVPRKQMRFPQQSPQFLSQWKPHWSLVSSQLTRTRSHGGGAARGEVSELINLGVEIGCIPTPLLLERGETLAAAVPWNVNS